jgi:5-methylcytosine-specific restriction endonuclease McrA
MSFAFLAILHKKKVFLHKNYIYLLYLKPIMVWQNPQDVRKTKSYRESMRRSHNDLNKELCGNCGNPKEEIHHDFSVSNYPNFADQEWNQVPKCKECHDKWHKIGTKKWVNDILK